MLTKSEVTRALKESLDGSYVFIQQLKNKYPGFHWCELKYPKTGDTVLHMASRNGFISLMKYLLTAFEPSAVDCKNNDNKTPLHEAAQFCQYESVRLLLDFAANVNALKRADWTPLMLACTKIQEGSSATVELLLNNNAIVNYRNKDGWTALHLICREGNVKIFQLLLKYGADLNIKTKNGHTPLHIASLHRNLGIIKELCSLKANLNDRDCCGNTPVHESVLASDIEICKYLISEGADYTLCNSEGFSLIHLAASQSDILMIKYILDELKFNVNDVTDKGFTILHCAARRNRQEVYNFLISRGANKEAVDNFGRTPTDYSHLSE